MAYNSTIMAYQKEAKTDPTSMEASLREMLTEVGPLFKSYVMGGVQASVTVPKSIMELVPEFDRAGITTEDQAKAYCDAFSIKYDAAQVSGAILCGQDRILNYIGFVTVGAPDKKTQEVVQYLKVRKNSKARMDDDSGNLTIEPTGKDKVLWVCNTLVGSQFYHARKSEQASKNGKTYPKTVCEANYNRMPKDGRSYGTPRETPAWLKPGETCMQCMYAPHRSQEDRGKVGPQEKCTAYCQFPVLVFGTIETITGWHGPFLWEVSGTWGLGLLKSSFVVAPNFPHIVGISSIKYGKKGSLNYRNIEVVNYTNPKVIVEGDPAWVGANNISAAFRRLLREKTKVNASAPTATTSLSPTGTEVAVSIDDDDPMSNV